MATAAPGRRLHLGGPEVREAAASSIILAAACLATYWLATNTLARIYSVSRPDDALGGMWAVIATIFVYRERHDQSIAAALSRLAATSVSFVLCLAYLLVFPADAGGMAVLIGLGVLFVMLIGRPGDAVTTGITTTVIMVVTILSPHDAWQQPILRFVDTLIGVALGLAAAWIGPLVIRRVRPPSRRDEG